MSQVEINPEESKSERSRPLTFNAELAAQEAEALVDGRSRVSIANALIASDL